MSEPFEDSRRLTGCNLYFDAPGAALESVRGLVFDDGAIERWRDNVAAARDALGWPPGEVYVRRHASGVSLAFAAPMDQLYSATEANEWAWGVALLPPLQGEGRGGDGFDFLVPKQSRETHPHPNPPLEGEGFKAFAPGYAAIWDAASALQTLRRLAAAEAEPVLVALAGEADARHLLLLPDDDAVSIGAGEGSRTWPMSTLPDAAEVPWHALHPIPVALVTGSNGKTTTVRLLASMLRASGLHTAHSCTEGVYFDNALIEGGDFSGPGGARTALRHPQAQAAVLETARGGLLRRGLALCHADAAIVTNISADHYGEYGVHDLDDLAAAKLVVAQAVGEGGLLVLNADDPVLRRHAPHFGCPIGWFAADFDAPLLAEHRAAGGTTCGARAGRLLLSQGGTEVDLGATADMPIALGGRAAYNVANGAAAALGAIALGVDADAIRATLAVFGTDPGDNPGRLQAWDIGGAQVVVDYAHNPDGLHRLFHALGAQTRSGRLAVVLGHAGNREDDDLRAVATTVAGYRPDRVLLKDIHGYERGRAPGEVAAIMRQALLDAGVPAAAIQTRLDEVEAARALLQELGPGDLVVLPLHEVAAREAVVRTLEAMRTRQWRPGDPLPERERDTHEGMAE